jgi:hypothetical protein
MTIGRVITFAEEDAARFDKLKLPDGRLCVDLRLPALRAELSRLGIPGAAAWTKTEWLSAYAATKVLP